MARWVVSAASLRLCSRPPGFLRSLSRRMRRAWGRGSTSWPVGWASVTAPAGQRSMVGAGDWPACRDYGRLGSAADRAGARRRLGVGVRQPRCGNDELPVAGAGHGAGSARAGRCAAITTFDLMDWSMDGEIAQRVAVDAPDRVIKLVLCATSPGSTNAHAPGHHDGVDGGRRRRDRGAGGADAAVSGARDRRHAHRCAAGPAIVLGRPRLPRTVGAVGGQDREKAVGWGATAIAILVPLVSSQFSLGLGQEDVVVARSSRRTSPRRRAWRPGQSGSTRRARPPVSLRSRSTGCWRRQPQTSSTRGARP